MPRARWFVWGGVALLVSLATLAAVRCFQSVGGASPLPLETLQRSGKVALPPHTTLSVAKRSSAGSPDNCADVTFVAGKEIDFDSLRARGFVVLKASCDQTLSQLVTLASCTRSTEGDPAQSPVHGVAHYYDLATLEGDDTYRGQCLGTGGSWKLNPQGEAERAARSTPLAGSTPHHEIDSLMELMP